MTGRPDLTFMRIIGLGLLAATLYAAPASAQGLFDSLFNGDRYAPRQQTYAPRGGNAYAPPQQSWGAWGQERAPESAPAPQSSGGTGRSVSYCVRLCDGRYFPMPRQANATAIQVCNSFCPASKTQVFNGSQIDHAVASSGARYADLDNAFVYRQKLVSDCTCNGKDAFGLAKIDIASDPTLKPGDIVASGDNVKVALTAMAASKERRDAAATAINERTALRGSATPKRAEVKPEAVVPGDASAEPEERPED